MATIITKNSSTASSVPSAGSLQQGELAVNVTDKKLYTKDSSAAVVKLVGSLGNQEANAVAITGGTINGTAIGGTTPAAAAFTTASASGGFTGNLTGNASTVTNGVYTTGSYADPAWITSLAGSKITGNISGNAANVTGTVAIANGGTGLTALGTGVQTALGQTVTGSGGIVLAASPSLTTPNLGTPSAATLTNATGLPVSTGISGLGTNVATALAVNVGSAGAFVVNGGALGTPSSGTLTNATGLPISTGVSGLGTGVATALAVNTGSSGAFVINGGALGTPSSGTLTNATGLPLSTGVTGTLAVANGGTGVTTSTGTGSVVLSSSPALTTPNLGTPSAVTLTNATGLPLSTGVTGTLAVANGGTGQTSYTDGQLLIGNTATGGLSKATLTAGSNVTITNGNGTITIAATGGGSATPGGSNTQVQYNSSGTFAGSANMTFDGTSLTLGGNPTLSAGTANGVAYLNGSKVLTTGSALTFDGTNLGVGVASPGQLIDGSAANPRIRLTATSTGYSASQFVNSSGSSYFGRDNSAGGFFGIANGTVVYSSTNDPIGFFLGTNEQMRLTSTGLGIGTSSPGAKLDVSGGNIRAIGGTNALIGAYAASSSSSQFALGNSSGTNHWVIYQTLNSSGQQGNLNIYDSVAAANRVIITTGGNLLVGTTTAAGMLTVSAPASTTYGTLNAASDGFGYLTLRNNGTDCGYVGPGALGGGNQLGLASAGATPIVFGTNGTERARITSGGNFGIGTSSPQARLHVSDGTNLYFGDVAPGWSGNPAVRNPANSGYLICMNGSTGGVGLTGGGTSWTSLSDERYKTNLAPIENGLSKVAQLRAVTGRYTNDEEGVSRPFLIAQDVQQVLPEAVSVADDGRMLLGYTDTIPLLVAAIKELKAELDTVKAELTTLKGK